jgi:hypothetical protein
MAGRRKKRIPEAENRKETKLIRKSGNQESNLAVEGQF